MGRCRPGRLGRDAAQALLGLLVGAASARLAGTQTPDSSFEPAASQRWNAGWRVAVAADGKQQLCRERKASRRWHCQVLGRGSLPELLCAGTELWQGVAFVTVALGCH